MHRVCPNCKGSGKWTKGPRPESCLRCNGEGQEFIGMTFDDAVDLAQLVMETPGLWHLESITVRDDNPFLEDEEQAALFSVVIWRAMMLSEKQPGIIRVTLTHPDQFPPLGINDD